LANSAIGSYPARLGLGFQFPWVRLAREAWLISWNVFLLAPVELHPRAIPSRLTSEKITSFEPSMMMSLTR
jgi:hypothetical protein